MGVSNQHPLRALPLTREPYHALRAQFREGSPRACSDGKKEEEKRAKPGEREHDIGVAVELGSRACARQSQTSGADSGGGSYQAHLCRGREERTSPLAKKDAKHAKDRGRLTISLGVLAPWRDQCFPPFPISRNHRVTLLFYESRLAGEPGGWPHRILPTSPSSLAARISTSTISSTEDASPTQTLR